MSAFQPATLRAHRARWFVYAGAERIPHTAGMRGLWGYDVDCSCGWRTRTGGGTRRAVADELWFHRHEAEAEAEAADAEPLEPADAEAFVWPAGKTFGELSPAERRAAGRQAAARLERELVANADAIAEVLGE